MHAEPSTRTFPHLVDELSLCSPARVLVAVQLADSDDDALRAAHAYVAQHGAKLAACHMLRDSDLARADDLVEQLDAAHWAVTSQIQRVLGSDVSFEVFLEIGEPHQVLARRAHDWRADQIVIAGRDDVGFLQRLAGRTPERIVRCAPCSVLVARPRPGSGSIVVGADLSEASRFALRAAAAEQRGTGAAVTLVHCIEPTYVAGPGAVDGPALPVDTDRIDAEVLAELHAEADAVGLDAEARIVHAPATHGLIEVATEIQADLVIVGTTGRTGLRRLLLGSVAEATVRDAPCAVLVARTRTGFEA